jgi:hypothetical protein
MPVLLDDDSIMPFGKYGKTRTRMRDVPASYLHWLWTQGLKNETRTNPVAAYIKDNMLHLKKEHPDGIWD